jgi:hypothetical protein
MVFLTGCTNSQGLQGTVKVDNIGTDTIVTYTFKNQSKKMKTVIGGAHYTLQKDKIVVDEGGVPIKDYIDLEAGQEYKDKKTFTNLQPGSYTIQVEWSETTVASDFTLN